jgi:hypothetical protein
LGVVSATPILLFGKTIYKGHVCGSVGAKPTIYGVGYPLAKTGVTSNPHWQKWEWQWPKFDFFFNIFNISLIFKLF